MVFGNNEGRMSWIFFLFLGEVQEKSWNFIFDYESVKLCYVLQVLVIARLRYINFRVGFAKSVSNKKQYCAWKSQGKLMEFLFDQENMLSVQKH